MATGVPTPEELEERVESMTLALDERRQQWQEAVALADDEDAADALFDVAEQLAWAKGELRRVRADIAQFAEEDAAEEAWRQRRAEGRRRVEEQRKRSLSFTDRQALSALRVLLKKSEAGAINAASVARRLGALPTHIDRINMGLALSRLSLSGEVVRLVRRNRSDAALLWSLPGQHVHQDVLRTHVVESRG